MDGDPYNHHGRQEDAELLERLAAAEHLRWSKWQRYVHSKCLCNNDGDLVIPSELVKRWERQMRTPYKALSDAEQESDRIEARMILRTIRG